MTNRELLYIVTIAELGNFSLAAEKLNISQSALSQAVHKVEEELGFKIFFRGGMKTCPTLLGKRVLWYGKPVLEKWKSFEKTLNDYSKLHEDSLSVYAPPLFCKSFLPAVVKRFNAKYPDISVSVVEAANSSEAESCAANEIADISLVWEPVANESLSRIPVFKTELLLAVPFDHPICLQHPFDGFEHVKTISKDALVQFKDYPFSLPCYSRTKKIVSEFVESLPFEPQVKESTSVWSYLIDYVSNRGRVALVDELECISNSVAEKMAFYRVGGANLTHSVVACLCYGKTLSRPAQLFLDVMKEYPRVASRPSA